MLREYPQFTKIHKIHRVNIVIEFILILLIIQLALLVLYGDRETKTEEMIQFRIVAHSNSPEDQQVKQQILDAVEPLIQQATVNTTSKQQVVDNLIAIEQQIFDIAQSKVASLPIQLERQNALLPVKHFNNFIQPQGHYDAYVLTIGSGRGENWWCALFPKVCYDEADEETDEEVEEEKVTFFIWEWIKKMFS